LSVTAEAASVAPLPKGPKMNCARSSVISFSTSFTACVLSLL
jgi:hypothetical protein